MYEGKQDPLLPRPAFFKRLLYHGLAAAGLVVVSLGIGMLGYHALEGLSWLDSLVNASMLLGGMGPVNELHTTGGKLFASFYALYSGLIFLIVAGVLFVPVFHRVLHSFHLDDDINDEEDARPESVKP